MRQSVRLGRVAGIPVGANWSVIAILAIIADMLAVSVLPAEVRHQSATMYWTTGCITAVLFLAALLAHELSHALVARRNGVRVRSITLWGLGGVSELEGDPLSAGADLRIALAGPAASLAAAGMFFGVAAAIGQARGPDIAVAAASWLAVMNGVLAVFNMLPGAPLDGGRVLRAALWRHYGDRDRAAISAARSGRYLGVLLAALGIAELLLFGNFLGGLWLMLIGWFLTSAAAAEEAAVKSAAALLGLRVADVMTPDPEIAPGWVTVAEFASRIAAAGSAQRAFPVLSSDARLAGIVVTAWLARLSREQRASRRVEQVALRVPEEYLAAPDDSARLLAARSPLGGEVVAVVLDHGRIVGMVTTADMHQAELRHGVLAGTPR
jgi:Zn-dependent protease